MKQSLSKTASLEVRKDCLLTALSAGFLMSILDTLYIDGPGVMKATRNTDYQVYQA